MFPVEIKGFLFEEKEENKKPKNNFQNYKSKNIMKKIKIKSQTPDLKESPSITLNLFFFSLSWSEIHKGNKIAASTFQTHCHCKRGVKPILIQYFSFHFRKF